MQSNAERRARFRQRQADKIAELERRIARLESLVTPLERTYAD